MNENNSLISVIVPIYNVEKYLHKCVDSILAQTYTNLEIILVDDGSPDNCSIICDEYAKKDSRIKVIHKENGGLSSARNAGLDIASGDYIGFVDSDDYIAPEMYKKLYNAILTNNSDMSVCKYSEINEQGNIINCVIPIENEIVSGATALKKLELSNGICFVAVWNKLFSAWLFSEIRFPLGKICEDNYIIHEIYNLCNSVTFITDNLYYYLQRNNSILHSVYNIKMADEIEGFYRRIKFLEKNNIDTDINAHYHQLLWAYRKFKTLYKLKSNKDTLRINEIEAMVSEICKKLGVQNLNWKEKLFFNCYPLYWFCDYVKNFKRMIK